MNGTVEGFASAVLKHIREERQRIMDRVAHGGVSDFNEYKICMGQIEALDSVEFRVKQIIATHSGVEDDF